MFVVVGYDIGSLFPLTCFHHYLLVFTMFIYLFLASSHKLYAELWLDFLSFAGTPSEVGVYHWHCSSLRWETPIRGPCIGRVLCRHWLGAYLHFRTYSTCYVFLCGLYALLRLIYC